MLEVNHLYKSYKGQPLITDISFELKMGETICLLGASGSGKSTLLKIIAGLENPDSGTVLFNGDDLMSTPPHLRDFGLVFQDYALFPHLNVYDNVAFGLRMRRLKAEVINQRVVNSVELVKLHGFENRQVTDLSGGEQQRVALARALAIRPRLLMFDEPLGALDKNLKDDLLDEMRQILRETGIPSIYVTHDQEEAFAIADRILILHNGKVDCDGTPAEVWSNPGSAYVAKFLEIGKIIDGDLIAVSKVQTSLGVFSVPRIRQFSLGDTVQLLIRSQDEGAEGNSVSGSVRDIVYQPDRYKVTLDNGVWAYMDDPPEMGKLITLPVKVEILE